MLQAALMLITRVKRINLNLRTSPHLGSHSMQMNAVQFISKLLDSNIFVSISCIELRGSNRQAVLNTAHKTYLKWK